MVEGIDFVADEYKKKVMELDARISSSKTILGSLSDDIKNAKNTILDREQKIRKLETKIDSMENEAQKNMLKYANDVAELNKLIDKVVMESKEEDKIEKKEKEVKDKEDLDIKLGNEDEKTDNDGKGNKGHE